ncbi:MAG: biotin--[acetyl-CoA-carboxylase] ligase [Candidatus Omnitrophota bacterium]
MEFRIQHFEHIDSTNSYLLGLARRGEPEGLVITAEYQSNGRGRLDRKWTSPRGENLLFSFLLRPPFPASKAPLLTQQTCQAVVYTLDRLFGIRSTVKKPNDVMVGGKKICGILVESESTSSARTIDFAVVGIGLNVNSEPVNLCKNATSVLAETGRITDLGYILDAFLSNFSDLYSKNMLSHFKH